MSKLIAFLAISAFAAGALAQPPVQIELLGNDLYTVARGYDGEIDALAEVQGDSAFLTPNIVAQVNDVLVNPTTESLVERKFASSAASASSGRFETKVVITEYETDTHLITITTVYVIDTQTGEVISTETFVKSVRKNYRMIDHPGGH